MKIKRLVRSIMSSIVEVILSPLYVLAMLVLWLVAIPLRAVVELVRLLAKRQEM